jgi:hypothetical protein
MTEATREYNLLQLLMKKTHLPWRWTTVSIAAVLFLLLILVVLLDSRPGDMLRWNFWRANLDGIITIIYILAIYPFVTKLREKAVQAFRSLSPLEDEDFKKVAADISKPNRWEWVAILLGILISGGLGQPWSLDWTSSLWSKIYLVTISFITWCLLCWLIFDIFVGIVRISRLSRQELKLDILDTETLAPVARWGLGISLIFAGGISLNLLFETTDSLLRWNNVTAYAIVVCVLVLIFYLSMWSTHKAMSLAKNRKLALARKHLVEISRELEERSVQNQISEMGTISSEITSWANYQRLVKEAPTWPFNANIIRRLIASIFVPAIVYLIKILAGLGIRF